MKSRYLGGLFATMLAATAIATVTAAVPPGAVATSNQAASSPDGRALARAAAQNLIESKAPELEIGADDAFVAKPVVSAANGLQYAPYERTYRGLPVIGGDFVVVTDKAGHILNTSVAQGSKTKLASVTPTLAKATAIQTSRRQLDHVDNVGATRLVVLRKAGSHLAWDTRVTGTDAVEPSSQSVYVDAVSGKVLDTKEHVLSGDGTAAYSGPNPVHLDTSLSGSTHSMKDPSTASRVCQDAANNQTFSGPDDLWGNGNATSKETGCVDAFFATQAQKAMLTAWLGRSGMDGGGGWVPMRVGLNDINAYYDGTQVQIGHSQAGKWIGSLDVVAHEYGHGIDDRTPGGISRSGTQEFVGDVFGALTEAYSNQPAQYDGPDYLVGEEIDLVGQGPIRNMYNPSAAGDPNCYSSSIPGTEVHAAAGPGNHWFYLLAEGSNPGGGKPVSPTCLGSSVTGIGIQKAGKIMYNAMLMKTSSSSYLKYRTWTLSAAKNLYPGSCVEFNTVKAAWNAVSVPAQTADPTCGSTGTVTVTNPGNKSGTVGSPIASFTLSASGGTTPYTWSATGLPAGVTIGSSTGTVSGTPTAGGTYNVTATATGSGGSGSGSTSFTFTIGGGGGSQLLLNPGFESGAMNWTGTAGPITNNAGRPARTGTWKMWLGGNGVTSTETEAQSVTIPASATSATLTFWIRIDSSETTTSTVYDTAKAQIVRSGVTTTLATYSNLNKNSTYVQKSFDVTAYKGSTISVKFLMNEDSSLQTSFVVDDTALNVS